MSYIYEKQTWENGDVITAEKLNHMEDGIKGVSVAVNDASGASFYGAKWNKTTHKLTRTGLAAAIPTDTTNFKHSGSVNENYANPFDGIFPWSDCRLCNIDLDAYLALTENDNIKDCVVAWEGDADFSYQHENGVWKYRPEFYGRSFEDNKDVHYQISAVPVEGWVHYPEVIVGRKRGSAVTRTIDGAEKTILLPVLGMPVKRVAMSTEHTYAKNGGMTLDSIHSIDGSALMFIIEYADINSDAIGLGVTSLYRENEDHFAAAATDSDVVKVVKADASANCIAGAIFDIGTAKGGVQVGSYYIVSVADDATDSTLLDVTLNEAVTVTTEHFWSIHGLINVADEAIGSKSGYIGTNGKCDCYYRGEVLWGNMFNYVLGAYHEKTTNHVWVAPDEESADARNAIDKAVDIDTGVVLSAENGYIGALGFAPAALGLAATGFCTAVGGSSTNPVGDYHYVAVGSDTVLIVGGHAYSGTYGGLFSWYWNSSASSASWYISARPRLKNP